MQPALNILGSHLDIFPFVVALSTAICCSCLSAMAHNHPIFFVQKISSLEILRNNENT